MPWSMLMDRQRPDGTTVRLNEKEQIAYLIVTLLPDNRVPDTVAMLKVLVGSGLTNEFYEWLLHGK